MVVTTAAAEADRGTNKTVRWQFKWNSPDTEGKLNASATDRLLELI